MLSLVLIENRQQQSSAFAHSSLFKSINTRLSEKILKNKGNST